jgi:hypothetical protein
MSGHYWNPRYMKAWSAICDRSPCDESTPFNVYAILRAEGIPTGSHWGIIQKAQSGAPHRIGKVGASQWRWQFDRETQ